MVFYGCLLYFQNCTRKAARISESAIWHHWCLGICKGHLTRLFKSFPPSPPEYLFITYNYKHNVRYMGQLITEVTHTRGPMRTQARQLHQRPDSYVTVITWLLKHKYQVLPIPYNTHSVCGDKHNLAAMESPEVSFWRIGSIRHLPFCKQCNESNAIISF